MNNYLSIQYLRGLAALMVVSLHLFTGGLFPETWATSWLRGGVDIFFVISGFIMVKSTENKDCSPQYFYLKRIIRIVPIYWVATIVTMQSVTWTGWHSVASFLFIPVLHPENGGFFPVLEPGWTLNYEMFFYLVFGASLLLPSGRRLFVTGILLTMLVTVGFIFPMSGAGEFYANTIVLEFILGMIIAKIGKPLPVLFVPFGFALMPILFTLTDMRFLALGVPAMLIVWGLASVEEKMPKLPILSLIGDASYSIYLFHLLALGSFAQIWNQYWAMSFMFFPASLAAAIGIGIFAHLLIEKPITAYLNERLRSARNMKDTQQMSLKNPI